MKTKHKILTIAATASLLAVLIISKQDNRSSELSNQISKSNSQKTLSKEVPKNIEEDIQDTYSKIIESHPKLAQDPTDPESIQSVANSLREKLNNAQAQLLHQNSQEGDGDSYHDSDTQNEVEIYIAENDEEYQQNIKAHIRESNEMKEETSKEKYTGNHFKY